MLLHSKDPLSLTWLRGHRRHADSSDSGIHSVSVGSTSSRVGGAGGGAPGPTWRHHLLGDWPGQERAARSRSQEDRSHGDKRQGPRARAHTATYRGQSAGSLLVRHEGKILARPGKGAALPSAEQQRRSRSCTVSGDPRLVRARARSGAAASSCRVSSRRLTAISSHHHIPRVVARPRPAPAPALSLASLSDPDLSSSGPASPAPAPDTEDTVSLAFIRSSAVTHSYIAARGQRERETEVYEVIPATIWTHHRGC